MTYLKNVLAIRDVLDKSDDSLGKEYIIYTFIQTTFFVSLSSFNRHL